MAYNKYYIKMPNNVTLDLIQGGMDTPDDKTLSLAFNNEDRFSFEDVKQMFADIPEITIWVCIVQRDGRETDHMPGTIHEGFTKLDKIEYQSDLDIWKVTLTKPNETEERLSELEDALNFLLMGGEE